MSDPKSQGAQCWICPECHDDKHHQAGDTYCVRQQLKSYRLQMVELFKMHVADADKARNETGNVDDRNYWLGVRQAYEDAAKEADQMGALYD